MPKTKISEFSATPGNNTDIDGINIAEGCAPSGINDAIRELMSQLKDFQAGTAGDSFNGPVGTTTAAAGAFTTLSASGNITVSGGTANGVAYLNGSKVLTTGSALTFDGSTLTATTTTGIPLVVTGTGSVGARIVGGSGVGAGSYLSLQAQGGNAALIATEASVVGSGTSTNLMLYGYGSNRIIMAPATAEVARFTSTGLGIGTSSPAAPLDVVANSSSFGISLRGRSADNIGTLGFYTNNGATNDAQIQMRPSDNEFRFLVGGARSQTFYTNGTERARITSGGEVLFGLTAQTNTPANGVVAQNLTGASQFLIGHSNGSGSGTYYEAYFYNSTNIGSITQNGTTGVLYNITSDYRLKNVVGAVTGAGERIDALLPVDYTWKADGAAARGFLAHEFQAVYPNSVTGTKDAVDAEGKPVYQQMQASTTEVIADLVAEIQSLRARVAQLEAK